MAEAVKRVRDGARKRSTKSTQFSIFPFEPIKQMRHEDVVIASGRPNDDRYAERNAPLSGLRRKGDSGAKTVIVETRSHACRV